MTGDEIRTRELAAAIREIQEKVRARHPGGSVSSSGIEFPDLMPILHARDAAGAKVASIGTVNPRPGGLVNQLIQSVKRLVARALDWHVREQVEFNRATIECIQSVLETFEANNRALSQLIGYTQAEISALRGEMAALREAIHTQIRSVQDDSAALRLEAQELKDVRKHWAEWRQHWESKQSESEIYLLRSVSELHGSFQHRAMKIEESFRAAMLEHNTAFQGLLANTAAEIQARLWNDLRNVRGEFEKLIFDELRVIRQRSMAPRASDPVAVAPRADAGPQIDWLKFADRFRGSEERIRASQELYINHFAGCSRVLDVGCGRGEFLEAARSAGIEAHGIDLSSESVALCRAKGLDAEVADLFDSLNSTPDRSLGGLYCSQVIEHLDPSRLPEFIRLAGAKLRPGAKIAFESPNPACLAIFATHFFLDPTHTRPVPAPLLAFYLEENGFGGVTIKDLSPAVDSMPELADLPPRVVGLLFGGLDYALLGEKL